MTVYKYYKTHKDRFISVWSIFENHCIFAGDYDDFMNTGEYIGDDEITHIKAIGTVTVLEV